MNSASFYFLLFVMTAITFGYIYKTKNFYSYCSYSSINNKSYFFHKEPNELYSKCENVFNFKSAPNFYSKLIIAFYKTLVEKEFTKAEYNEMEQWIKAQNQKYLLLRLTLLKYCNMAGYIIFLYFGTVLIPKLLFLFMYSFFSKVLIIIFNLLTIDFLVTFFEIEQFKMIFSNIWGYLDKIKQLIM